MHASARGQESVLFNRPLVQTTVSPIRQQQVQERLAVPRRIRGPLAHTAQSLFDVFIDQAQSSLNLKLPRLPLPYALHFLLNHTAPHIELRLPPPASS